MEFSLKKKVQRVTGYFSLFILLFIGIVLLWSNEGRAAKAEKIISEAKKNYVDVKSNAIDRKNDDKLISTNGNIEVNQTNNLTDNLFGVGTKTAKLVRVVEMYQWQEYCTSDSDDNVTCSYSKTWDNNLVDSTTFEQTGMDNPKSMPYSREVFTASDAKVGQYTLSSSLLKQLSTREKMTLAQTQEATNLGFTAAEDYYTNSKTNPPEVGDLRISYYYSGATAVSVLAKQSGEKLLPYETKGVTIEELQEGTYNGQEMLHRLTNQNKTITLIFRIFGFVLIMVSFTGIARPIRWITRFIPGLNIIASFLTSFMSLLLGVGLSLLIIGIAWLRYRPLIGIGLLLAVGIIVFLIVILLKKKKKKNEEENNKTSAVSQEASQQLPNQSQVMSEQQPMQQQNNFAQTPVYQQEQQNNFAQTPVYQPAQQNNFAQTPVYQPAQQNNFAQTPVYQPTQQNNFAQTPVYQPAQQDNFTQTPVYQPAQQNEFAQTPVYQPTQQSGVQQPVTNQINNQ